MQAGSISCHLRLMRLVRGIRHTVHLLGALLLLVALWLPGLPATPPARAMAPQAIGTTGAGWGWGSNGSGQLGPSAPPISSTNAVPIGNSLPAVTAMAAGGSHSLALGSDGTVWAWGDNGWGQLGNGSTSPSSTPVRATHPGFCTLACFVPLTGITAVAAGIQHSLALDTNSTVWAWGDNEFGELGNGTTSNTPNTTAVPVTGIGGTVTAIAVGGFFSLALTSNGTVWAWGDNSWGQLGNGSTSATNPTIVQVLKAPSSCGINQGACPLTGITAIAAGRYHSLALDSSGNVWAWGYNGDGELGTSNSATPNSTVAIQVSGLSGVTAIAAGGQHNLALAGGAVWAWGYNHSLQLGRTTTNASDPTPAQVSGIAGAVTAIAAGYDHSLALTSDGRVWAWGDDASGQLGVPGAAFAGQCHDFEGGTYPCSATPVLVTNPSDPTGKLTGVVSLGTGSSSGHGLAVVAPPAVTLNPTTLTFGDQLVNTASNAQSVQVTNTGPSALWVKSVASDNADFTSADTCVTAPIAAKSSCTINVTFKPSTTGSRNGKLSIVDNAADSPQTVTLTGNGVLPTNTPTNTSTNSPSSTPTRVSPSNTPTTRPANTAVSTGSPPPSNTPTTRPSSTPTRVRPTSTPTATPTPGYAVDSVFAGVGANKINVYDPAGQLLQVLDTGSQSAREKGMCFDASGNLYVANFDAQTLSKFDVHGHLRAARWAGPFTADPKDPESCVVDSAGHIYVGIVAFESTARGGVLHKYDADGHLLATYHPAVDGRGVDWIDLATNNCTLYYTSEGTGVKRFDICANRQLADFASGLAGPCYALRVRPNGEVLVACYPRVYRLDPGGHVIQTYTRESVGERSNFFALNLDPDGTSFWTAGEEAGTGNIYRIDIETGRKLFAFAVPVFQVLGGLAVYGEITAVQPALAISGPPPSALSSGDTVAVGVQAAPRAQVSETVQVVAPKTVTVGSGKKRRTLTRLVVLYQTDVRGTADRQGRFVGHLHITYNPSKPTPGLLIVRATTKRGTTTRTTHVTIRPRLPLSLTVTPRAVVTGQAVKVRVRTVADAALTITVQVIQTTYVKTGKGGKAAHTTVLYHLAVTGKADKHGTYVGTLQIGYRPRGTAGVRATVAVRAQARQGTATSSAQITVKAPS